MVDYQFLPNPSIAAPTILYVPPLIYPSGYSIEVELLNWKIPANLELSSVLEIIVIFADVAEPQLGVGRDPVQLGAHHFDQLGHGSYCAETKRNVA